MAIFKTRTTAEITEIGADKVLGATSIGVIKSALSHKPTVVARMHGEIERSADGAVDLAAEVRKHPDDLWLRVKAIEADRENDNGDYFSRDEILKSYKTFEGCPVFTNHENDKVENAKGKVVMAEWDDEDNSVFCTMRIDRQASPALCRAIEEGYVTDVSMGTQVDYSICSVCRNQSHTADGYCTHVKTMKGRSVEGKKVYEENYGLKFIEISVVTDGACKDCTIREVLDPEDYAAAAEKLMAAARRHGEVKTSLLKNSGQAEIDQLNAAMTNIESVLRAMLDQREYIDLEFMSNLTEVFAELQHVTDELVDQGYASLGGQQQQPAGIPQMPETGKEEGMTPTNAPSTGPSGTGVGTVTRPAAASGDAGGLRTSSMDEVRDKIKRLQAIALRLETINKTKGDAHVSKAKKNPKTIAKLSSIWGNPSVKDFKTEVSEGDFRIVVGNDEILGMRGGEKVASLKIEELDQDIQDALETDRQETASAILDAFKSTHKQASMSKKAEAAPVDGKEQVQQTMEAQLRDQDIPLHPRQNDPRHSITEGQMSQDHDGYDHHKQGKEAPRHEITEKQLQRGGPSYDMYEFHAVQDKPRDEIQEIQLRNTGWQGNSTPAGTDQQWAAGVDDQNQQITEGQLDDWKSADNMHQPKHEITEKQLRDQNDPLGRRLASINRDNALEAVEGGREAIVRTAKATGATPDELIEAINDFWSTSEKTDMATKVASRLDEEKARMTRGAQFKRASFYGAPKTASMNEVCSYLLGSLSDENLAPEAGLKVLKVIASQDDASKKIAEAIEAGVREPKVEEPKTDSQEDILQEAMSGKIEEQKQASNKQEEVTVLVGASEIKADQSDKESYANAAFELGAKYASGRGIKITKNIHVKDAGDGQVEVAMMGVKEAAISKRVKALCNCEKGACGDDCECPEDCECKQASSNKEQKKASKINYEKKAEKKDIKARAKSRKEMVEAQFGGEGGGMPAPGFEAGGPGAAGGTTMPAMPPGDDMGAGVGALTDEEPMGGDSMDDNPESLPPGSICPSCGSDDVDVRGGSMQCNNCGAEGQIEVSIKMTNWPDTIQEKDPADGNDEEDDMGIGDMKGGEGMEMPQIGIASTFRITPQMVKKAGGKPVGSHCPHCGSEKVKISSSKKSAKCSECSGRYRIDTYVDTKNKGLVGRIAWVSKDVSKMAAKMAKKASLKAKMAKVRGKETSEKGDVLSLALKAKGWSEKFASASLADQAEMVARLAEQGLVPKK